MRDDIRKSGHYGHYYNSILGKELYPVACFDFENNSRYIFDKYKGRYYMVR